MMSKIKAQSEVDVVLVGAGIMSATLAYLLHQLDPQLNIVMLERADAVASESSDAWNNAGTGLPVVPFLEMVLIERDLLLPGGRRIRIDLCR